MATQVKHRRGTNAEIMAGTPAIGELWFNTTDNSIHMGDGVTPGGVKHLNVASLANYTGLVYKPSGGRNAIDNMVSGSPVSASVGDVVTAGLSVFTRVSNLGALSDFVAIGDLHAVDFLPVPYVDDGTVDYRTEINEAVSKGSEGGVSVFLPDFKVQVGFDGSGYGVIIPSNSDIRFQTNTVLEATPNDLVNTEVISIRDASNIQVHNPKIIGDKYTHTGVTGEFGMGVAIRGNCSNIHFYDSNIDDCWGDGVYIGQVSAGSTPTDVYFHGLTRIKNCRRQGVSVISADGLTFDHLRVTGTKSSDSSVTLAGGPHAGIDIEPNDVDSTVKGVKIGMLSGGSNDGGLFYVFFGAIATLAGNRYHVDVSVDTVTDDGSTFAVQCAGLNKDARYSGQISIGSVTSNNAQLNGIGLRNWATQSNLPVNIERAQISNWLSSATNPARNRTAVSLYQTSDPTYPAIGNLRIGSLDLSSTISSNALYQAAIFSENSSGAGTASVDITITRVKAERLLFAEISGGVMDIKNPDRFGSGLAFLRETSATISTTIVADIDVTPSGASPTLTLPDTLSAIYVGRKLRLRFTEGGTATFVRIRSSTLPLYVNGESGSNFLFYETSGIVNIEFADGRYFINCQGAYVRES